MPIQGRLYPSSELQALLGVKRAAISRLAKRHDWASPQPGLYWAADVEKYLKGRGVEPATLEVIKQD